MFTQTLYTEISKNKSKIYEKKTLTKPNIHSII